MRMNAGAEGGRGGRGGGGRGRGGTVEEADGVLSCGGVCILAEAVAAQSVTNL
jgi:hypothetical protein